MKPLHLTAMVEDQIINRHGNGARTREACPGHAPILMGKIRVDQGRGRVWVFPDNQSWVRDRVWNY